MPTGDDTARLLARVPLFADLSERDLAQLAQVAVPRSYEAGEAVFREGDSGDTCYVVREGSVRITRRHSDGRVITLAELREGAIFGELAMFGGETRSASVEALERTRALAILSADMRRIMLRHPEIAVKMLEGLADRLRGANERIARQSFQTVAGRVASALLSQAQARSSSASCAAAASPTSACWRRWPRSRASGSCPRTCARTPTATARCRSARGRRSRSPGSWPA
jgi:CRP-like cAMP-binding protein